MLDPAAVFQSTRPVRGATKPVSAPPAPHAVSIHAPRAGRDVPFIPGHKVTFVSIHAPRAGRDRIRLKTNVLSWCFNPRAPCGARLYSTSLFHRRHGFNPRAPCGARLVPPCPRTTSLCFNPRAPCGARLSSICYSVCYRNVSIHAPRAGRDSSAQHPPLPRDSFNPRAPCGARPTLVFVRVAVTAFQSTRPVRGATRMDAAA